MSGAGVEEVELTADEELACLCEQLERWRRLYPSAGLLIGVADIEGRHYRVRLALSNTNPVELMMLADRALEEAAEQLAAMPFDEADAQLTKVVEARTALGFVGANPLHRKSLN